MTLALALTGVVFLLLSMVMGVPREGAYRRKTLEVVTGVEYAALALSVIFFLASIWTHALT